MSISRTVVISCAGMGNRLGFGSTKALVEVEGKPLIIHHLEMLKEESDIRVVVGYQADEVIEVVKHFREDVLFVFNHDYRNTGTGASVALAAKFANEYILSLDGDLLIHPEDMKKILAYEGEFVSGGIPDSDDPWMMQTYREAGQEYACKFSKSVGTYEWNGVTQIQSAKMLSGTGHVFQMVEKYLPLPFMELRTREIDTINDYERAVEWVKNHYEEVEK